MAATAVRTAATEGRGAVLAPLAMGGAGGLRAGGPPADRLARWLDGMENGMPVREAASGRHRGVVGTGGSRDGAAVGAHATGLAHRAARLATRPCPDGRGADGRQSRGRPAQPCLDGSTGSDPRDDRAVAVSDVARHEPKTATTCMAFWSTASYWGRSRSANRFGRRRSR